MKMEIDNETADRIVICALQDSMGPLRDDIVKLKRKKKLKGHEKENLANFIRHLDAIEAVYDYFGGNLK